MSNEEQAMIADYVAREVVRGYKVGFVHGFAAFACGWLIYNFIF